MKKIFVMLFAIIGLSTIVSAADYCKINGAYGSVSVNGARLVKIGGGDQVTKYMLSFNLDNSSDHKVNVSYNAVGIPSTATIDSGNKSDNVNINAGGSRYVNIVFYLVNSKTPSSEVNVYGADCLN